MAWRSSHARFRFAWDDSAMADSGATPTWPHPAGSCLSAFERRLDRAAANTSASGRFFTDVQAFENDPSQVAVLNASDRAVVDALVRMAGMRATSEPRRSVPRVAAYWSNELSGVDEPMAGFGRRGVRGPQGIWMGGRVGRDASRSFSAFAAILVDSAVLIAHLRGYLAELAGALQA